MTKQITEQQLAEITWIIESTEADDLNADEHEEIVGLDDNDDPIIETRYNYWLCGSTVLRAKEYPEITYAIDWMANPEKGSRAESLEEAYDFKVEFNEACENVLDMGGYVAVDDDGDEIDADDAERIVRDEVAQNVEWEVAAEKRLPKRPGPVAVDEDTDEDDDMETITVERDNDADLRFKGEQVATASSHHFEGPRNIRWTELTLYRTKGGKLVCEEIGRTRWQGERTRHSAVVADTEAELVKALGYGWLAKDLYEAAGIDYAVEIE
ncbi:hypothetical protein K1Y77_17165 (plasmid) [Halomonas qaidamensis]|uniref:Uncharacterized protein n=1 Tax=Halomonas qaidamensis TaxID=2866211 RepID=A0ABY6JV72_9GAMM|nr:hypothetical protein [Halomonas qaidamensis]UYV20949.1 hypothetical protein K1Y77_17165 [Halomonas qaidamensis]